MGGVEWEGPRDLIWRENGLVSAQTFHPPPLPKMPQSWLVPQPENSRLSIYFTNFQPHCVKGLGHDASLAYWHSLSIRAQPILRQRISKVTQDCGAGLVTWVKMSGGWSQVCESGGGGTIRPFGPSAIGKPSGRDLGSWRRVGEQESRWRKEGKCELTDVSSQHKIWLHCPFKVQALRI